MSDDFNLNTLAISLIVSFLPLGSLFGSIFSGFLSDKLGRKRSMHLQNISYIIGAIVCASASRLEVLYIGRFIVGLGASLSAVSDVPYLNEISPAATRGCLSSSFEIQIVFGTVIGSLLCLLISNVNSTSGWRILVSVPIVPAFINSLCLCLIPESPKWLFQRGYEQEAKTALTKLRTGRLDLMSVCTLLSHPPSPSLSLGSVKKNDQQDLQKHMLNSQLSSSSTSSSSDEEQTRLSTIEGEGGTGLEGEIENEYLSLVKESQQMNEELDHTSHHSIFQTYRYPLILVIFLMFFIQFSGSVVIRSYAPNIFRQAGFSLNLSFALNFILSVVNFFFVCTASYRTDRTGRKFLLLLGIVVILAGLLLLSLGFLSSRSQGNIPIFLISCLLTSIGFNVGFGPVGWLLASEMFPSRIRGRALAISTAFRNIFEFVSQFLFPAWVEWIGPGFTFGIYFLITIVSFFFVFGWLVETKARSPEEILFSLTRQSQRETSWTQAIDWRTWGSDSSKHSISDPSPPSLPPLSPSISSPISSSPSTPSPLSHQSYLSSHSSERDD